jgi:hypothetical protein
MAAGTAIFGAWPKVSSIVAAAFCDGATPPTLSRQGGLVGAITGVVRNATGSFTFTCDTTKTGPLTSLNIQATAYLIVLGNNAVPAVSVVSATQITVLLQDTNKDPVDAAFFLELSRR